MYVRQADGAISLCLPYAADALHGWRPDGVWQDLFAGETPSDKIMDDLIFCSVGVGLFLAFGVYAALLKRL